MYGPLQALLKQRGLNVKRGTVKKVLTDIDRNVPWFVVSGDLTLTCWDKLGKDLDKAKEEDMVSGATLPLWCMVRTCLEEGCSTDLIQEGQRALSRHQDSLSEASSNKGGVVRPKKRQPEKKEVGASHTKEEEASHIKEKEASHKKEKEASHKKEKEASHKKEKEASHKEPEGLQPSHKRVQEEKREKKAYPEHKKEGIGSKDLKSKEKHLEKQKDKTSDGTRKGPSAPLYPSLREFYSNNSYSALSGDEERSSEEESSLEDSEDSSSSESSLDSEEEEELEEEAARYEEERYGHRRLRSSGAMAAPCSPSAPLPYSGVGRSHFIKGKVWSRLASAFPVFENLVTQERAYGPVFYKQLKDLMKTALHSSCSFLPFMGIAQQHRDLG
ncbi:hypothetical protein STEG23_013848 [Scotinomys teguina]